MITKLYKRFLSRLAYRSTIRRLLRTPNIQSEQDLFFIVSAGRSGSTLLRKHLIANNLVSIPPESENFIPRMVEFWFETKDYNSFVRKAISYCQTQNYFESWKLKWGEIENELIQTPISDKNLGDFIVHIYKSYNMDAIRIGDKTPFLVYYLDLVKAIFPNCKVVYLIRDGRAVVNSYVNSRGYEIDKAINRWKISVNSFLNSRLSKSGSAIVVRYEDFILNTRENLSNICEFINIPFIEGMITPEFVDMGDTNLDHHANVKNTLNVKSIEKWKEELSDADISKINQELQTELKIFNYLS
ncbi:MAG: sulfotransferase [Flavobacteriales bacterium]|nr:sulfotransferase [Flavobacteriales bacterium]